MAALTVEEFNTIQLPKVPLASYWGVRALEIETGFARLEMPSLSEGASSGQPIGRAALLALVDFAAWAAVLSLVGMVDKAVTTSLEAHFFEMLTSGVIAEARTYPPANGFVISAIEIFDSVGNLVARASCTYALPV